MSGGFATVQPDSSMSINAPEGYPLEDFSADAIRSQIAESQKVANGSGSEQEIAEAKIELEVCCCPLSSDPSAGPLCDASRQYQAVAMRRDAQRNRTWILTARFRSSRLLPPTSNKHGSLLVEAMRSFVHQKTPLPTDFP